MEKLEFEKSAINDEFIKYRKEIHQSFVDSPLKDEDLMFNLGLYTRSSLLVKFFVIEDLYKRILNVPGNIYEFGTWWGQNLVLFENLRSIFEPFNKHRKVIGFDTFSGYLDNNSYSTSKNYKEYLADLIASHEKSNVLGHINNNHSLIEGDVCLTVPKHFEENMHEIIALAYLDIGTYEETKVILQTIKPFLISGSVILLDQFSWKELPGESIAFKEVFGLEGYRFEKCALYPSKTIVTIN
jgi:hypothetical protein